MLTIEKRTCSNCGHVSASKLQICNGCHVKRYCGVPCQRAHFTRQHKYECRIIREFERDRREACIMEELRAMHDVEIVGGWCHRGDRVAACSDIMRSGRVVVLSGTCGIVRGPSSNNSSVNLYVFFEDSADDFYRLLCLSWDQVRRIEDAGTMRVISESCSSSSNGGSHDDDGDYEMPLGRDGVGHHTVANEQQERERQETLRLGSEDARAQAQRERFRMLTALSESYNSLQLERAAAIEVHGLLACARKCEDLCSEVASKLEGDDPPEQISLLIALRAECLTAAVPQLEVGEGVHAGRLACQLLSSLPSTLPTDLQDHRMQMEADAHIATGLAHLALGDREAAKEEALLVKGLSRNADLGMLGDLLRESCNWGCGLLFPLEATKRIKHLHRSEECPMRPVQCKKCGAKGIAFRDLDSHERDVCPAMPLTCPACQLHVARSLLQSGAHSRDECPKRHVPCPGEGCSWTGPSESLAAHEMHCPVAAVECPACLELLPRWKMRNHLCPLVDGSDPCIICSDELARKPVAILLRGARRACAHVHMCMDCVSAWQKECASKKARELKMKRKSDITVACPICKEEYDSVTALPDHLIIPLDVDQQSVLHPAPVVTKQKRYVPTFSEPIVPPHCVLREGAGSQKRLEAARPKEPVRKGVDIRNWQVFFLSPIEIHFTHSDITEHFRPPYPHILDTAQQLALESGIPKELECLDVVWRDGRWYVAGTFNRRLCMFRLLAIFLPERFRRVQVRRVPWESVRWTCANGRDKFSTQVQGDWIEVRWGRYVGKTFEEVNWPEAVLLFDRLRHNIMS